MTTLARVGPAVFPLYGPPEFPVAKYVQRLTHPYMTARSPAADQYRYELCRMNPVMFALHYLGRRHLTMPDDRGRTIHALASMHLELAASARRWAVRDLGAGQVRDAYAWPRKSGKTSWSLLVLPLWAMAYRHRNYLVVYSDTEGQAAQHLSTLKLELADNDRLARDFPDLVEPLRVGGRAIRNTATAYLAANGAMIEAKGMNSATLGAKFRERRPDALLLDEIEPVEGKYSAEQKKRRLTDMIDGIFEVNDSAVVHITGTTVMSGSIVDDLLRGADWVKAQGITVHHVRGIETDPVSGEERSCWPRRWSLDELRAKRERNPRGYSKNYENAPISEDGTFWRAEHITYDPMTDWLTDRILVIDPATKSKKSNDETGIGKLAFAGSMRRVVVEDVIGVRLPPDQLRAQVHATVRRNGIRLILVDTTNGGDHVLNTLNPLPAGVRVKPVHIKRSKLDRFTDLHDLYLRSPAQVVHARPISGLEAQMLSYPNVLHDDQLDVVALGVEHWLPESFRGAGK